MSLRKTMKQMLNPLRSWATGDLRSIAADQLLLAGKAASRHVRSLNVVSSLQEVEFKISSQWGEDGILDWLIERANIPPAAHSFIEFGVETYREANTRFLLQNRNWRGLIMDGDPALVDAVKIDGLAWKYQLDARAAFITRENINTLISEAGFVGEIGLLSIDLDGNDYWIWEAIEVVRPILCVCEYNAVFGDIHPISTPYDPAFVWTKAHYSNLYCGASIQALCSLAARKGYRFVGTTMAANDAFFVRKDYAAKFVEHSLLNISAMPSLVRGSRGKAGELTYIGGLQRLNLIASMPVVNTETGNLFELGKLRPVYTETWLERMTGKSTSP